LPNGNAADPLRSAPQKQRPVLFVHGHNPDDANDADFNYRETWVQAVDGLPSFQQTLDDATNTATLDIEGSPPKHERESRSRPVTGAATVLHSAPVGRSPPTRSRSNRP
jgi:hypothetical protein